MTTPAQEQHLLKRLDFTPDVPRCENCHRPASRAVGYLGPDRAPIWELVCYDHAEQVRTTTRVFNDRSL